MSITIIRELALDMDYAHGMVRHRSRAHRAAGRCSRNGDDEMTTVTYQVHHWTDEDTGAGDCFEVLECVTTHTVTGDEYAECGVASFGTMEEAQAFIRALTA